MYLKISIFRMIILITTVGFLSIAVVLQAQTIPPNLEPIAVDNADQITELKVIEASRSRVFGVTFSPDDQILASSGWDGSVHLWDVISGTELGDLSHDTTTVFDSTFSPDGALIAVGSIEGGLYIWDVNSREELFAFNEHTNTIFHIAFNPDGTILASGSWDGKVILRDVDTGEILNILEDVAYDVNKCRF